MPFWRCYYHVIWATKSRVAWITPNIEKVIFECIEEKARSLESPLHAVSTVEDHMHVAVSIPPKLSVAEWVKQAKGNTTREINARFPDLDTAFSWQNGYGVLSFGAKNLDFVVNYVTRQKEHHANLTLKSYLEQVDDET